MFMRSADQRLGRPAGFRVSVEVRAPPVHRFEERAQSGAGRPTSREIPSQERGSSDPILRITQTIPASRSAISGLVTDEEELDYEDEVPVLGVRAAAAQKATSSGRAVQGDRLSSRRELAGSLRRVAEIPWAGTGSGCAEDGGSQGVMGIRRVRMLELVQQSIAPSTRRSYEQAWLEFLKSGAVKQEGGVEACEIQREDAIHFIMQQIEFGLSAVTISGCVGGPDGGCSVWIVGHSFVRWAEKQVASRHFGTQLGLDGARIRINWVGKSGKRWGELLSVLSRRMEREIFPDLLVIHLVENDLVSLSGIGLLKTMKIDLVRIKERWAGRHIVWTGMVPRRVWRGAYSFSGIEKQRRKVNREMRKCCQEKGFSFLLHENLVASAVELFRQDGVHLTFMGNKLYLLDLRIMIADLLGEKLWDRKFVGLGRKTPGGFSWVAGDLHR
ncbi:hypothetical protein NDU88_003515 [Pleurodeles waltl]|uniref:Uncharacterized protein n=1 Tax=Pleurodeles waltl TaxID=8319 RepID=A0AAV7LHA3_PLEWA|nr:hypothetical protein NDU88_003515 [Pleurodeles waltl]